MAANPPPTDWGNEPAPGSATTMEARGDHSAYMAERKKAYINKMKNNEQFHSDSYKLKKLQQNSAAARAGGPSMPNDIDKLEAVNPIWMNFPSKCVTPIKSVEEMKKKLAFHTHSDEVFVVRYHQNNCTACNALDKSFEYLCHEARRHYPKLTFYEINKDEQPELTKGMVRFPQVKAFAAGQWTDIDFKPSQKYREGLMESVEREVTRQKNAGNPLTALQVEEMYFSAAGPAMLTVLEGNIIQFYAKAQARLHNYFKQVSIRRSWFYKKYIQPEVDSDLTDSWNAKSVLGEKIVHGPQLPPSEL